MVFCCRFTVAFGRTGVQIKRAKRAPKVKRRNEMLNMLLNWQGFDLIDTDRLISKDREIHQIRIPYLSTVINTIFNEFQCFDIRFWFDQSLSQRAVTV